MAYPTVDKPYGLKPVNLIGGQVFAGATRQMEIATTAKSVMPLAFLWRFGHTSNWRND
jgi:hypothetical protein